MAPRKNDFVVKLRVLIKAAPAWKPAFDNGLNKTVDSKTRFYIIIHKGNIKIDMQGVDDKTLKATCNLSMSHPHSLSEVFHFG